MTCKDCKWWSADGDEAPQGDCHRMPPVFVVVPYNAKPPSVSVSWPATRPTNWCGEFTPKKPKKETR